MRVLHLIRTLDPAIGGPLTYLETVCAALQGSSVEVTIGTLSPHAGNSLSHLVVNPGLSGMRAVSPPRFAGWLTSVVRTTDIVHIHGIFGWVELLEAWYCVRRGVPYVISTHGNLHPNALAKKWLKKQLYLCLFGRAVLARAATIVATTEHEASDVRRIVDHPCIQVVRPAVLAPAAAAAAPAAVSGTSREGMSVVFIGRLHPHKGLPLLIKALSELRRRGVAASLSLIGDGEREYIEDMRRLARDLQVHDAMTFHGYLSGDRKWAVLRAADVLALPSYSENFSFATAEALACGVPVVVTREVGLADLVRDSNCGRVVPVGDASALASALFELTDTALRSELSRNARHCADMHLSINHLRARLLELYGALTAPVAADA